jgi:hypothetical protein
MFVAWLLLLVPAVIDVCRQTPHLRIKIPVGFTRGLGGYLWLLCSTSSGQCESYKSLLKNDTLAGVWLARQKSLMLVANSVISLAYLIWLLMRFRIKMENPDCVCTCLLRLWSKNIREWWSHLNRMLLSVWRRANEIDYVQYMKEKTALCKLLSMTIQRGQTWWLYWDYHQPNEPTRQWRHYQISPNLLGYYSHARECISRAPTWDVESGMYSVSRSVYLHYLKYCASTMAWQSREYSDC